MGMLNFVASAALVGVVSLVTGFALAPPLSAQATTLDFEGLPDVTSIETLDRVTFSSNWLSITSCTAGGQGNFIDPPSGTGIAFIQLGGPGTSGTITFPAAVSSVQMRCISRSGQLTLTGFDQAGNIVDVTTALQTAFSDIGACGLSDSWSSLMVSSDSTPMTSVTVTDTGNMFAIDDLTFGGCAPPAGQAPTPVQPKNIALGLGCGPTDSSPLRTWRDEAGNEFQLFCDAATAEFRLYYAPALGIPRFVGRCPWVGGKNFGFIQTAGDSDGDGEFDCFLRSYWRSREPGDLDCPPCGDQGQRGLLDWKTYDFDVPSETLVLKYFDSVDGPGGGEADTLVEMAVNVDPASFRSLPGPRQGQDGHTAPPMTADTFAPCDVDLDGDCDAQDLTLAMQALGECQDGLNYNEIADADHDGCVNSFDIDQLFEVSANAGGPYEVNCANGLTRMRLDGTGSYGSEQSRLTFTWTTDCPNGDFDNPHSRRPLLQSPDGIENCIVTLTVTNGTQTDVHSTQIVCTSP